MTKIRILSDDLVSKIAAGEIVERPSSVVKELVENSLDASSAEIRIEVKGGGKRLISIVDDGEGMGRDDALLSLERNATSKLKNHMDLYNIATLGFRGEALPSIASVSRFKLISKTLDAVIGTAITVIGGKIKRVEEIGCPPGTSVEVKDLFFNTPPRLKFMKKRETELSNILDIVQREAVANPDVGFELISDGNTLIKLPKRTSVEDRIGEIWKKQELYKVEHETDGIKLSGYLASPEGALSSPYKFYVSINKRAVKDRFVTRIVIDSFGRLIDRGKYPQGLLLFDVDPQQVDVNVHPAKTEVKFRNPRLIATIIKSAVTEMINNSPWIKSYAHPEHNVNLSRRVRDDHPVNLSSQPPQSDSIHPPSDDIPRYGGDEFESREPEAKFSRSEAVTRDSAVNGDLSVGAVSEGNEKSFELFEQSAGYFSRMKLVGQIGGLYIICESPSRGAVIIDQHAAHERINYERIKSAYDKNGLETQKLLIPVLVDVAASEFELIKSFIPEILNLGIEVEQFGDNAFRIDSVPALLGAADPEKLFRDILAELKDLGAEKSLSGYIDNVIATMACHSSVRANDYLGEEHMQSLLEELDKCEFPHACPHGRPVAREITYHELEKMFKRV